MSTALIQQPSSISRAATACRTQILIDATAVGADDRVLVIGPSSLDHLLGLFRTGCKSAAAVRSHALCPGEGEESDVVWLTGVASIDAEVIGMIDHLDTPRVVAIELTRDCAKARLPAMLQLLRTKGLVDQAVSKADGRTMVVASRPAWLKRVI
jgi:hypothetical protein